MKKSQLMSTLFLKRFYSLSNLHREGEQKHKTRLAIKVQIAEIILRTLIPSKIQFPLEIVRYEI